MSQKTIQEIIAVVVVATVVVPTVIGLLGFIGL